MKRKLSFKVYLTVLLLLVSFGVRASTVVGSITLEQIEYSLYDDYTAVVSDGRAVLEILLFLNQWNMKVLLIL